MERKVFNPWRQIKPKLMGLLEFIKNNDETILSVKGTLQFCFDMCQPEALPSEFCTKQRFNYILFEVRVHITANTI
jgi:hypothetical protein